MAVKFAPGLLALALMAFAPVITTGVAFAVSKGCPPGLAKKKLTMCAAGSGQEGCDH